MDNSPFSTYSARLSMIICCVLTTHTPCPYKFAVQNIMRKISTEPIPAALRSNDTNISIGASSKLYTLYMCAQLDTHLRLRRGSVAQLCAHRHEIVRTIYLQFRVIFFRRSLVQSVERNSPNPDLNMARLRLLNMARSDPNNGLVEDAYWGCGMPNPMSKRDQGVSINLLSHCP